MADAVTIARLDDFIGEQMQTPALDSCGRSAANGGDEEGFGISIEFAGFAVGLLLTIHRAFDLTYGEALSGLVNGEGADAEGAP